MDDDEQDLTILGLAGGLDVPTAFSMADDGDDGGGNDDSDGNGNGCCCLAILVAVLLLTGLLIS